MTPKVCIVILNWNGLEDTVECLESLRRIDYDNYEVIVVDNNSSGDDANVIEARFSNYIKQIIVNKSNLGFSGGNNLGIEAALQRNADVVLLLNNDTIVEPDFLKKLVLASAEHSDAGILTPMINYDSNRSVIWSAGGGISKIRASGFSAGYNKADVNYRNNSYCTFASGCCMYIRKEVFIKIGLLDEKYFLYLEDTDFCYRTIMNGFKILFVGESTIYHKIQSATGRENSLLPFYYSLRNRLYFARKNLGSFYSLSVVYLIGAFMLKIILPSGNKLQQIKIVFRSFRDFYTGKMGRTRIFEEMKH